MWPSSLLGRISLLLNWKTKAKSSNCAENICPVPEILVIVLLCHSWSNSWSFVVCRDQALGVKDNVDEVLSDFGLIEKSLSDLEDRVQNSTDLTDGLKTRLLQVRREEQQRMPRLHFASWRWFLWFSSFPLRSKTSWALQRGIWTRPPQW